MCGGEKRRGGGERRRGGVARRGMGGGGEMRRAEEGRRGGEGERAAWGTSTESADRIQSAEMSGFREITYATIIVEISTRGRLPSWG